MYVQVWREEAAGSGPLTPTTSCIFYFFFFHFSLVLKSVFNFHGHKKKASLHSLFSHRDFDSSPIMYYGMG